MMIKSIEATMVTADANIVSTAIHCGGYQGASVTLETFAVGCITATCNVYLQGSQTYTTTTFRRIKKMGVYSGGSGLLDWEIPSTTGNINVSDIPIQGYKWVRLEYSNTLTAAAAATVHLFNNY